MRWAVGRLLEDPSDDPSAPLGTAFFVTSTYAVTAFHCVADRHSGEVLYSEPVVLFDDGFMARTQFYDGDPGADFAILAAEPIPTSLTPLHLTLEAKVHDRYRCIGYPDVPGPASYVVSGLVRDSDARLFDARVPALQLYAEEAAAGLSLHGLSGAPVLIGNPESAAAVIRWNPESDASLGIAVGGTVYATPFQAIVDRLPELKQQVRARQPLLRDSLNSVFQRHAVFGGRDPELELLDRFVESDHSALLVTAPSGFGKTALLANWVQRLERSGQAVAHHFISRLDDSASEATALLSLCEQLMAVAGEERSLPENVLRLRALCPRLVESASARGSLVLVVDGVDEAVDWRPHVSVFGGAHLPACQRITRNPHSRSRKFPRWDDVGSGWCFGEFVDVGVTCLVGAPAGGEQLLGELLGELADLECELAAFLAR